MSYLIGIVLLLLVILGIVEVLIIRKGMKAGRKSSSYLRERSVLSPSPSRKNKPTQRKELQQESFSNQEDIAEPANSGENVIGFPQKPPKTAELSDIKQEIRQKESPVQEQSMLDIIQEIRGETPHIREDSYEFSQEKRDTKTPQEEADDLKAESIKEPIPKVNYETDKEILEVECDTEKIDSQQTPSDREDIKEAYQEVASSEELIKIGLELIRKGELDEGISKLEEIIAHVPEKADAHFNLGIAYTLKENIPQAISSYQRAIEIDSKYGKAFFNLGTLYLKQGTVREAITKLEQAVKLLPDSMKALWNLYEAYRSSGLFTKALASLQKLVELEPEDASLYNHLGICYVKLGDYTKAIDSWKRSLSLGALSPLIHYNLGKTYELCGDFDAAKEHYERFITPTAKTSEWQELVTEVQDRLDNLQS